MKEKKNKKAQQVQRRLSSYWIPLLVLAAIATICYYNSFDVPLVFDDMLTIQKNAGVRFGDYFTGELLWTRSLLFFTFAVNHYLHGQEVWGYHLINVIFHLINGLLIFFIAEHLFAKMLQDDQKSRSWALLASSFFLAHPIQTESVTYVSSRSELVSVLFFALAFLLFIKRPEHKVNFVFSLVIIGIFVLALGGKETAITLPAILVLYDYLLLSNCSIRPILGRWRFYLVFVSSATAAGVYIAMRLLRGTIGAQEGHLGYWQYFLTQTQVIVKYMRMVILPYGQNLDHDVRIPLSAWDPRVIGAALLIIGIIYSAWTLRRRQPILSFAIFFFFITLSPTSSFVPILDLMFEHRLYMPFMGLCLAFPVVVDLIVRVIKRRFSYSLSFARASSVIIIVLMILSVMRNQIWRDETTLWADAIRKSPQKARPRNALSMAYYKRGDYEKAIDVGERAIQANPDIELVFSETLGNMYLKLGKYEKAIGYFSKIAENNKTGMAYNNVGVTYLYMWDTLKQQRPTLSEQEFRQRQSHILTSASRAFEKTMEIEPHFLWALDAYVNVQHDLGNAENARSEAEGKLQQGEHFASLYIIGKLFFNQDRFSEALPFFERAARVVRQDEDHKLFFYNFGFVLTQAGQLDRAIEAYTTAVKIDPIFIEAFHNLALIYARKDDLNNAIVNFNEALSADANHVRTHIELAKIYIRQAKWAQARAHLQSALSREPQNPQALQLIQRIGA